MGASLSNLSVDVGDGSGGPGLGDIPESCVACVFTYLTPPEICNLARLNRAFRGAASSDSVWELKLPPTYSQLLSLLPPGASLLSKKKDIFAFLSRPVPFDDLYKVLWLDTVTGGVCLSVSAKAMAITGIEDRRYWSWIPTQESRFQVVAFLQQIWWFEVQGLIKFPFPPGVYSLSFRLHLGKFFRRLGRRACSYDQTHGWDLKPVRFDLSTSDGQNVSRECCLDEPESSNYMGFCKRGCWIEYLVGDFVVTGSETLDLRFSMKQIDCTHSKGGLCVDSVSIMPSELRDRALKKL
ncbi:F-box protein PP2-A15-like [Zingiber officinale]|uniref:F-box protein PP2-A15-like n=1 Tax=Zingiber officinale TaxID=94328 RepID=UPI001C4AECA9|nr:F-box protein PP2-A15-like [Zingiber officinale]